MKKGYVCIYIYLMLQTLLGANTSSEKALLKMIFLFQRWDMLAPGEYGYHIYMYIYINTVIFFMQVNPYLFLFTQNNLAVWVGKWWWFLFSILRIYRHYSHITIWIANWVPSWFAQWPGGGFHVGICKS